MNNLIIENLIAKICHDLMNPLGTAQMAIESNEMKYVATSIEDLTLKVEIFRSLFKDGIDNETQYSVLEKYIKNNEINIKINKKHEKLAPLLYCIVSKMIKNSYVYVEENTIYLQTCFVNEDEQNIINGQNEGITSRNVLLYIAIQKAKTLFNLNIIQLDQNEFKIILTYKKFNTI